MLNGTTDPANSLGENGDFYINTTTYFLFGPKANDLWNEQTAISLVGPEGPAGAGGWALTGNAGTVPGTNFLGTTDDQPLQFKVNNIYSGWISGAGSTSFGYQAFGPTNTTIDANTAFGFRALTAATGAGIANAAFGRRTLNQLTTGLSNSAFGDQCMLNTTTGGFNCAIGQGTLGANTTGNNNTALGYRAMNDNTIGFSNVAIGINALRRNTERGNLVAIGDSALFNNGVGAVFDPIEGIVEAFSNTAVGSKSLFANTKGSFNTAMGNLALRNNTIGDNNTAVGDGAISASTAGDRSTAVGALALANTTASFNTALGYGTGPSSNSSSNTTSLGYQATCTGGNMVRLGNSAVTSIGGYAGWTNISDARVKDDVRTDVPGLEFISRLRPVTYHLNIDRIAAHLNEDTQVDKHGNRVPRLASAEELQARSEKAALRYTGFIAQEVEAAAQATGFDFSGVDKTGGGDDLIGLRYAEFVVPLVKAVQEQQAIIEELGKRIAELERR